MIFHKVVYLPNSPNILLRCCMGKNSGSGGALGGSGEPGGRSPGGFPWRVGGFRGRNLEEFRGILKQCSGIQGGIVLDTICLDRLFSIQYVEHLFNNLHKP